MDKIQLTDHPKHTQMDYQMEIEEENPWWDENWSGFKWDKFYISSEQNQVRVTEEVIRGERTAKFSAPATSSTPSLPAAKTAPATQGTTTTTTLVTATSTTKPKNCD